MTKSLGVITAACIALGAGTIVAQQIRQKAPQLITTSTGTLTAVPGGGVPNEQPVNQLPGLDLAVLHAVRGRRGQAASRPADPTGRAGAAGFAQAQR